MKWNREINSLTQLNEEQNLPNSIVVNVGLQVKVDAKEFHRDKG